MVTDLAKLAQLKEIQRLNGFRDITQDELSGFRLFMKKCTFMKVAMPHNMVNEVEHLYRAGWERAYWFGFHRACERHE